MTADQQISAGTHVLMPVKATPEMTAAIEGYYFSRVMNKGKEKKDGARRDAVLADCWQALMAYYAMVEAVRAASTGRTG